MTLLVCPTVVVIPRRRIARPNSSDDSTDPPRLDGDYVRDESEQVRYLEELHGIFAVCV